MKERLILFNGAMVRALLAGTKTQTRRAVKVSLRTPGLAACLTPPVGLSPSLRAARELCPYGQPGDRLWVREAWRVSNKHNAIPPRDIPARKCTVFYEAGGSMANQKNGRWEEDRNYSASDAGDWVGKYRPPMFMPRWASRMILEITDVRVERLQDISEADARAEGLTDGGCTNCGEPEPCGCLSPAPDARDSYCRLWESINGAGSWGANPWVWAVSFKVVTE